MPAPSVKTILAEAADIPDPAERAAFLDRACGGDPAVRAEVDRLLAWHRQAGRFLESSAPAAGPTVESGAATVGAGAAGRAAGGGGGEAGRVIAGRYKLVERVGEGGMGSVWTADQTEPVRRRVAVKLIKAGLDSAQVVARFEAERQALALMDHPHIAKVLDGGVHDGRPFFVMELVKGVPITDFCDARRLTPRERLELFVPVCQAIQHAHQKGVIHRDIKPANVLVALYDDKPVPKVIDFGVAKATGAALTEHTLNTGFGGVVGTPAYMSPEQATFNNLDIDTRSDVYSLGVLLYELLAGSPPFKQQELERRGLLEMLRVVREDEPPRPSTKLSTADALPSLAANRGTEPRKLTGLLRHELDWIVMKALEKDRARRYETANGFALDVQRYLAGEPVVAHPPKMWYRFHKFTRRHKVGIVVAALAAGLLLVVAGSVGWVSADRASRRARADERAGEAVSRMEAALAAGDPDAADLLAAVGQAEAELAGGWVSEGVRRRAERALADRAMLAVLDRIRLEQAEETTDGKFTISASDPAYANAFRGYGVDLDTTEPEAAGARLRERPITVHLATAVDGWAHCRRLKVGGNPDEWARLLAVSRAADPDPWRCALRSAWAAKDGAALTELGRSAGLGDQPVGNLVLLAASLDQTGDTNGAVAVLRAGQRRHPADFWTSHNLGMYLARSRPPRPEEAVGFLRAAVALRPRSGIVQYNLGTALAHQNKVADAADSFRQAIRVLPDYARAHYNLGTMRLRQGQPADAEKCFREAVRLRPEYAMAHTNLGVALMAQKRGRIEEAIACYREAIRLEPGLANAHTCLGTALLEVGQVASAERSYREAIRLDPNSAEAHFSLGLALSRQRKVVDAVASLREAIHFKNDYAPPRNQLAWLLTTNPDLRAEHREAVTHARKAVELVPGKGGYWNTQGVALYRDGDWAGAADALAKATELQNGGTATDFFFLAMAHQKLGDHGKARDWFDHGVAWMDKNAPKDPELIRFRTEAAELLGVEKTPAAPTPPKK